MLTTVEILAAAKKAQRLPSNAALARLLGVPDKYVQRWGTGKHTPDDVTAARLAELAGLDVGEVLASVAAERASEPAARELWQRLAARLHAAGLAALAVILSLWIGGGPDGAAMASTPGASISPHLSITDATRYTLSRVLAWLRRLMTANDGRCTPHFPPLFALESAA